MNSDEAYAYLRDVLSRHGHDYAAQVLELTDPWALIERTFTTDENGDLAPQEWANDPHKVRAIATHCEPIQGVPVESSRPCPEWCEHSGEHPFIHTEPRTLTLVTDDPSDLYAERPALLRIHRRRLGNEPDHAAIELWERAHGFTKDSDSPSERAALMIGIYLASNADSSPVYLTAEQARLLSDQLRRAADYADSTSISSKDVIR